jgi:hypothetical protein
MIGAPPTNTNESTMNLREGWSEAVAAVNAGFVGEARPPGPPEARPHFVDVQRATEDLPPVARERLLKLRQRHQDMRATIDGVTEQRNSAWSDITDCERQHRTLVGPHSRGGFQKSPNDPEVARVSARLESARDRRRRAVEHLDGLNRAAAPLGQLLDHNVQRFLRGGGPQQLFTGQLPQPPRNEPALTTIKRTRGVIEDLKKQIAKLERSPVPQAEAIARAKLEIERKAESGRPNVMGLFGRDRQYVAIGWPSANTRLALYGHSLPSAEGDIVRQLQGFAAGDAIDTPALLVWLFKNEIEERIITEIKGRAVEADALDDQALAARRADLEARLLESERIEAQAIERAESEGAQIELRANMSVKALLHLA